MEISIVVPVFNAEAVLTNCLDSILHQTFVDFELILIDDGSRDRSLEICKTYAKADSRIRIIHQENKGVSAARNAGIDVSEGNYIMFCDSDDTVLPQWCEKLYCAILKHPGAWVLCEVNREVASGEWKASSAQITEGGRYDKLNLSYFDIFKLGLSGFVYNKIYESEKIKKGKISFDEQSDLGEDVRFNIQYFETCKYIVYLKETLYEYHYSKEGLVNKKRDNKAELHLRPFFDRIPLIEKSKMKEYCDIWLYQLMYLLDDDLTLFGGKRKTEYGKRMFSSQELQYCIDCAGGEKESVLYMKILRKHSYLYYRLFKRAVKFKNRWIVREKVQNE